MSRHSKFTTSQIQDMIDDYSKYHLPLNSIAKSYSITKMAVWKILRKNGVNTSKVSTMVSTKCHWCQKPIQVKKCIYNMYLHHFCCNHHYFQWLNRNVSPFIRHRHSIKIAKKVVSKYFQLSSDHVIHFLDGDQANNSPQNLSVFNSRKEYIKFRRGFGIEPLWNGKNSL